MSLKLFLYLNKLLFSLKLAVPVDLKKFFGKARNKNKNKFKKQGKFLERFFMIDWEQQIVDFSTVQDKIHFF